MAVSTMGMSLAAEKMISGGKAKAGNGVSWILWPG